MKKFSLTLFCVFMTCLSYGQNPYEVNVPSKNNDLMPNEGKSEFSKKFIYIPIYSWDVGMKFIVEPDRRNSSYTLDLFPYKSKDKFADRIKVKTFEYKICTFKGFEERKGQTFVQFECEGKKYEQETFPFAGIDKMKKYEAEGKGFLNVIKHLIYTGEIDTLKANLVGKRIWLLSSMWMRDDEDGYGAHQKDGFKYYPAVVSQVGVGSADAPIRVVFKPDNLNEAYIDIYLSGINQRNKPHGLHFDKVFSFEDPKTKYPKISKENWSLIQSGKVKIGMNEEECKLSWGKPDKINSTILEGLVSEQWVYGGSFLYLTNGLLTSIQN